MNSSASDKEAVLAELVALAVPDGPGRVALLADVRRREGQFTTALRDGIAMPHARSPHVSSLQLAAVSLRTPVAFDAADGKPVELAFLVASPADAPGAHLEALRELSQLFANRRAMTDLRLADSAAAFQNILRRAAAE